MLDIFKIKKNKEDEMWGKEKRPTGVLGYRRELGLSDLQIHRNLVRDSHVTLL